MAKTAFLFPGQGAQYVGMGKDLAEGSEAARKVFERADRVLGFALSEICFEGPEDRLTATDISQPAILTTSWAAVAALRETPAGRDLGEPDAAAGLSLGEYTALLAARALGFEDAVRVTHLRGRYMQEACDAAPSGMVSLLGVDEAGAEKICEAARTVGRIWPANFNSPGQVVVSGDAGACEKVVETAESLGAQRAVPLQVAGGFHCPLMSPAREKLTPELEGLRIREPALPVVANTTGDYYSGAAEAPRVLADQVDSPVRWQQGIERLVADGVERFIEIGPGRVLVGLLRRVDRALGRAAENVGTMDQVRAFGEKG